MKYTALIVDDEPNARAYLTELVDANASLQLCGTCASGNEALEFCKTLEPDILFLDIQMPGKNGIATAQALMNKKIASVVVFTTAYDQYAIQAFEVEAIGYLLKPFSKEQFSSAVTRAIAMRKTLKKTQFSEQLNQLFEQHHSSTPAVITEFVVVEKGLEIRIGCKQIDYLISSSEYVEIHTQSRKYLKRLTLEQLAKQLPPRFLRVHRSIIINRDHVRKWSYLNNGTYTFQFQNGVTLKSARSYQKAIREVLSKDH